ncbi:MAG TPA: 2-oxoacid:acceptor oxidoreductase subunit alpha [Ardenticatenaceae bacterium]
MSVIDFQSNPLIHSREEVINDFSLVVATINGTGSQTANNAIIRALFKMGLPVTGKNLFPSNISGLPTWYTIRISEDGYTARREGVEILVAYNEKTQKEDIAALPSGGICIYPLDWKGFEASREDIVYYGIPVKEFVKASGAPFNLRDYVANMAYVGALIELLGIEYDEVKNALVRHFNGKMKPVELNMGVADMAIAWVRENLQKQDPYRVERRNLTEGLMLLDGNTAGAIGSIYGGVSVVAWYPITPATSFADGLNDWLPKLRHTEDGKPTYAVIQAEDELAAIGMVLGASWAGARAITSTSGPGISLMAEFAGFSFYAEVPAVIWDIQRMGPSTGLPTRVSQGDITFAYTLSHGDTKHIVLFPGNIKECFDFGIAALDLSEQFQTLVLVLSDLDLGMNQWMSEPFDYPTEPLARGKVLAKEDLDGLAEQRWGRYRDLDGDGVPYRTLPGTEHPLAAYFTRGSGHNEWGVYSERPDDWEQNMERLLRKHDTARAFVPKPIINDHHAEGARVAFLTVGTNEAAVHEAQDRLAKEGVQTGYLRVRALPLSPEVSQWAEQYERVYVVEMNSTGQLCGLLRQEHPELATRFVPLNHNDGLPLTAAWVVRAFTEKEQ